LIIENNVKDAASLNRFFSVLSRLYHKHATSRVRVDHPTIPQRLWSAVRNRASIRQLQIAVAIAGAEKNRQANGAANLSCERSSP
jgi:hypothetical protein